MWETGRIVGSGGVYDKPPTIGTTYFPQVGWHPAYYDAGRAAGDNMVMSDGSSDPMDGSWHRVDLYLKLSTPAMADGAAWVQVDGNVDAAWDPAMIRAGGTTWGIDSILTSHMWVNCTYGLNFYVWVDDVYVADSQARVEICAGGVCEIQPIQSWSDASITFDYHQGLLPDSGAATLYVYAADGRVAYKDITLGRAADRYDIWPYGPSAGFVDMYDCVFAQYFVGDWDGDGTPNTANDFWLYMWDASNYLHTLQ